MSDSEQPVPEQNPYDPPKAKAGPVGSRSEERQGGRWRVAVIVLSILLIPPAVAIAFFFTCLAVGGAANNFEGGMLAGVVIGVIVLIALVSLARKLVQNSR